MLSYNDALRHSQSSSEATCVVCHDLSEHIIWHKVKLQGWLDEHTYIAEDRPELTVPICIDCADLFHDVKPQAR